MIDPELREILQRIEAKLDAALDPDAARLQTLLPAIAAQTGGKGFEVSDLEGEVDFGGLTAPQVGLLLKRNCHRVIAGFKITRHPRRNGIREWSVTPFGTSPE